jgi:Flp pilus assembly pilin Flp
MLRFLQISDDVRERADELTEQVGDQLGQIVDQAKADPALLAILIAVGVITAIVFLWGVVKQVFKAALVAGLLSAGAWYWYFNIR